MFDSPHGDVPVQSGESAKDGEEHVSVTAIFVLIPRLDNPERIGVLDDPDVLGLVL